MLIFRGVILGIFGNTLSHPTPVLIPEIFLGQPVEVGPKEENPSQEKVLEAGVFYEFFLGEFGELGKINMDTLQETNISPKNGILKMIFLFPRWDMLIPWRVSVMLCLSLSGLSTPAPSLYLYFSQDSRLVFEGFFLFSTCLSSTSRDFHTMSGGGDFSCVFRKIFCFSCQIAWFSRCFFVVSKRCDEVFEKYSAALQGIFKESAHKYLSKEAPIKTEGKHPPQKKTTFFSCHFVSCWDWDFDGFWIFNGGMKVKRAWVLANPSNDHRSSHL